MLSQAGWCTVIGLAVGSCGALATAGVLRQLLFLVAPTDAVAYVVAIGAAAFPASLAARIDPLVDLRRE